MSDTLAESDISHTAASSESNASIGAADLPAFEGSALPIELQASVHTIAPAITRPLRSKQHSIISLVLLGLLFSGIYIPTIIACGYGINAYETYIVLHDEAESGVQHLLNVKTIFTGVKTHPTSFLDVHKLHLAQTEFVAAHEDFQQLQATLDHSDIIQVVTVYLPQYSAEIATARAGSQIAIDVSDIGQALTNTALLLAPTLSGPLLTNASEPLITPAMLVLMSITIDEVLPHLRNIQAQTHLLSIPALPISADKRDLLVQLMQAIPQVTADLAQLRNLQDTVGWMLGVNEPRTFLVQTMDRAELRPTGGFTGQYSELKISGGRVAPFSLKDISFVEYVDTSRTLGQLALPQYRSWWPFANWGLRDSNLSADFPTSAQIAIAQYKHEVGHQIDGVVVFTPLLVEHVLEIIGPVSMPAYHETITSQNLETRLHYYQQDNTGIRKQELTQHVEDPAVARKLFTASLAHTLLDQVRQASPNQMLAIVRQMLHDLQTKDLQVYVSNPQIEGLLVQYGDAAQLDRSSTHDGLYVVQANISASKASQYVRTSIHDTVTLNSLGGATHVMQLRLLYNQLGPVYGYDTYRDYVRVYVPPTSTFLWGDGFDTGIPLCGGSYTACPRHDVYPKDELLCPSGLFQPGASAPSLDDPNGGRWHPLDTIGPPTNLSSDESGRAMFGGWVIVPKNCTMTVTLSWYVPPMGTHPYSLLVQRQAGTFPELDLTILPIPGSCAVLKAQGQHFDDIMGKDMFFALKKFSGTGQAGLNCYPQPPI